MRNCTCISTPTLKPLLQGALVFLLLAACGTSGESGEGDTSRTVPPGTGEAIAATDFAQDTMLTLVDDSATAALTDSTWSPSGEADLRGRPVVLNPALTQSSDTLAEGRRLLLNLFDDRRFEGVLTRAGRNFADVVSVAGRIPSEDGAWFTMSLDSSQILAHIYFIQPKRYITVYYSDELKQHVVVERDPALEKALPEHPPVIPPDSTDNQQSP